MIAYALIRNSTDGYTYSCEILEGIYATEDAALGAQIEAEKTTPSSANENGEYEIQEWDMDTGKRRECPAQSGD